ncbi:hypothetical protein ACFVT5_09250 [Streptomyces sp. NPDC058001]|uniref:nitroreductase family protein n=1 Tax=Streptomyces sp. NPDC058001 TaxID=3346300 RepID=UPI0036E6C46F
MSTYVHEALARARSAEAPGPDLPPTEPARPSGEPVAVPAALDRTLRLSLAGRRLRPVPSAGALHPVDTWLLVGADGGVRPGRYAYDPGRHRLHRVGPAPDPVPPGVFAVLAARPERTVSHYRHRAWPLVLLDVGHAVAALALTARHPVCLSSAVLRTTAVPAPPGTGLPLAVVRLTSHGELEPWCTSETPEPAMTIPADAHPDLVEAYRVLGAISAAGATERRWFTPRTGAVPDSLLLGRRSAEPSVLGRSRRPGAEALARVLAVAESAMSDDGPHWCLAVGAPEPGLLGAKDGKPTVLATGDVLPTLAEWAARQGWIGGAGAVLIAYGCPSDAGPARIGRDHLLAGYGVGHAQLTASALGLASRPVGSWQGADLGAALGGPPGRDWIVHGLALGTPTTDALGTPTADPLGTPTTNARGTPTTRAPGMPTTQGEPTS